MAYKKQPHKNEQGIALMLVLGVMSILIGIALTFASSMRLTEKTSKNYYYSWQALYTARAGMHRAIFLLKRDAVNVADELHTNPNTFSNVNGADTNCDNLNEEWFTHFNGSDVCLGSDNSGNTPYSRWVPFTDPGYINLGPNIYTRYAVLVRDEAGKLNVNVARKYKGKQGMSTFELSLNDAFTSENVDGTVVDNIIDYLYGDDKNPGDHDSDDNQNNHAFGGALDDGRDDNPATPIDDANEGMNDPYEYCPFDPLESDDRIFHSLDEVEDTNKSTIDPANFPYIEDYITVYSKDEEQYLDTTNPSYPKWSNKMCINYVENASSIYNILSPSNVGTEDIEKALAIIDYIDEDAIPSAYSLANGSILYGMEGVTISEIMPQPALTFTYANDLFDTVAKRADWSLAGDRSITGTTGQVTASLATDCLRPGRYQLYLQAFSDSGCGALDNRFTATFTDTSTSETITNSTLGGHTASSAAEEWKWTAVGTIDITDPASCTLQLSSAAGAATVSALQGISLTQQGPPGNETHDSEFIELFNKSRRDIYIGGWQVRITPGSTTPNNDTVSYTIPLFTETDGSYFTYANAAPITMNKLPKWYRPVVPSGGRLVLTKDLASTGIFTGGNAAYDDAFSTHPSLLPPADNNGDTINFESSFGDGSGLWGDTTSEQYPVIALGNFSFNNDTSDYLVELYAPKYNTLSNNVGYIDSVYFVKPRGDNRSNERILPFAQYKIFPALANQDMYNSDATGSSAGNYYSTDPFMTDAVFTNDHTATNNVFYNSPIKDNTTPWLIKDGNLAALPEMLDIPYAYNSATNNTMTLTVDELKLFADKATPTYIKIEAEDCTIKPTGISPETGLYGTDWYSLIDSMPYFTFGWTSGIRADSGRASYFDYGTNYKLFAFGKPAVPFEILGYSDEFYPLPRGGTYIGKMNTTVDNSAGPRPSFTLNIEDYAATSGNSYFDHLILTPGNPMAGRININTVIDPRVLLALPGITSESYANVLMDNRPYYSQSDLINQITKATGRLYNTSPNITMDQYNMMANLITFRSDIFEIICTGQVYLDKDGDGIPEKILGTQTVKAVIDRSDFVKNKNTGKIKTLYYRVIQN